jgi:hypothetical protein
LKVFHKEKKKKQGEDNADNSTVKVIIKDKEVEVSKHRGAGGRGIEPLPSPLNY